LLVCLLACWNLHCTDLLELIESRMDVCRGIDSLESEWERCTHGGM
jgi:hypothetical protein